MSTIVSSTGNFCIQFIPRSGPAKLHDKSRPPDKSAWLKNNFRILNRNICSCGYSKEPSQRDGSCWGGSFEHPKHMFKLMDWEIIAILGWKTFINWTYAKDRTWSGSKLFHVWKLWKIKLTEAWRIKGHVSTWNIHFKGTNLLLCITLTNNRYPLREIIGNFQGS